MAKRAVPCRAGPCYTGHISLNGPCRAGTVGLRLGPSTALGGLRAGTAHSRTGPCRARTGPKIVGRGPALLARPSWPAIYVRPLAKNPRWSIVGLGGVGKTTLAKKIFNDTEINKAFGSKIWLSVTERYDEEKLLSSAISQAAGGGNNNVPGGDKQLLSLALIGALSSRGKFLLVLDDDWSDGAWTCLLRDPIVEAARKHPGSRVIITTRNNEFTNETVGATHFAYHVQPMSGEDAWSLLKEQLPPQDVDGERGLDHLKHIGMGIISNCAGLPLAIKAIGGLLRT
ncbi:hypothetical protein EJB05_50435, partial [Eragrostis curvula]